LIFALLDYWQYRRQRGRYAPAHFRVPNIRLMSAANFPDLYTFKPGDLFLLHTRGSVISWAVMYFTQSVWSHTGLFSGSGNILHATTSGVIEEPFASHFDNHSFACLIDPGLSDEGREKAISYARSRLGAPYGWGIVLVHAVDAILSRREEIHMRLYADVLFVFGVMSLPAIRWRWWLYCTESLAVLYLMAITRNRVAGKTKRSRGRESGA